MGGCALISILLLSLDFSESGIIMAFEKNAPPNRKDDFGAPTQESSPETGASSRLVEAFEYGVGDTANDVSDMRRLGKRQEFRVPQPASYR